MAPDDYSEPHLDSAALHLDVASRHMKFQKKLLIHASMIRIFSSISHGSELLQFFDSFYCLYGIFIRSECSQTEVAFSARAKA